MQIVYDGTWFSESPGCPGGLSKGGGGRGGSVAPKRLAVVVAWRLRQAVGQCRLRGQLVAVFDIPQLPMRACAVSIEFGLVPPIPMLLMSYPVPLITSSRQSVAGAGPIDTGADSAASSNSRRCRAHHASAQAG